MPQPFTLNDISVAVWKVCPEFFGMKGYPYPDNHKVHYILYGSRGLIARGILQRVRQGLFRIAEGAGLEEALTERTTETQRTQRKDKHREEDKEKKEDKRAGESSAPPPII